MDEYIRDAIINKDYESIINYIVRYNYNRMRNAKIHSLASMIGDIDNTGDFEEWIHMIHTYAYGSATLNRFFLIMIIEEKYNKASIIFPYLSGFSENNNIFDFVEYSKFYWSYKEFRYKLDKFISKYYHKYKFNFYDKVKLFI